MTAQIISSAFLSLLGATVPAQVAHNQHLATMQTQGQMHQRAMAAAVAQSHELAEFDAQLHDRAVRRAQRLHYETVAYELDIARREVARDIWSQKNNLVQTLMVVNTVMVISIYSLLIQGYEAPNAGVLTESHTAAFTILCSLAVGAHILSVFVAFKLNSRTIQFQMHNPRTRYRPCGKTHLDFDDFFRCHGAAIESLAFYLFYVGTSLSLISSGMFIWMIDLGMSDANNNDSSGSAGHGDLSVVNAIVAILGVVASVLVYFLWK